MSKLRVTELDFEQILTNLKNYLRNRPEFKDYDFEGSGLALLTDYLAYNTMYGAFYTNMVGAEMFLDTAELRESVVSNAKHLAYVPRSIRSARAFINITFNITTTPSEIIVPRGTAFSARGPDDEIRTFTTVHTHVVRPDVLGDYYLENVEIIEGIRLIHRFPVDYSGPDKPRFILPNANVDTTDLVVKVQNSATSTVQIPYQKAEDINELTSTDRVYFLQEIEDGLFEIYFGDDIIGQEPADGAVVVVDYVVSSGTNGNSISTFSPVNGVGGFPSSQISIETISAAEGGAVAESSDSIKLLAPLNWEAQDRAVTQRDYETLVKKDYPEIEFVRVWGGQDNDPPQYGRVFVSLKPVEGLILSASQKQAIIDDIIRRRNIISLEVVLVEPEFTFITFDTEVRYKSSLTTTPGGTIKSDVINTIQEYRDDSLAGFDTVFRYSKLTKLIDETNDAIQNNSALLKMTNRITPPLNVPTTFTVKFNNPIDRGDATNDISTLQSSGFIYKGVQSFLGDDGKGSIYIYRIFVNQKIIFETGVGTIDYDNGIINLDAFTPEAITSGEETIDLTVVPAKDDLFALRNQVLLLEPQDVSVTVIDETTGQTF